MERSTTEKKAAMTADREILNRLGAGEPIAAVCESAGISRDEFDNWWRKTCESRVPVAANVRIAELTATVDIARDEFGIPHVFAGNDRDLFFGFGFAMAEDRLFQLDYLRRKGLGRLAEILGPRGLETDIIARTVGLNRIAANELERLPTATRTLLDSFCAGINAVIDQSGDALPVEFDLLDYRPEPFSAVDCLAIENEFRWYLTGRFPAVVIPELAKRALKDDRLYHDFLLGEDDDESILVSGMYRPSPRGASESVGQAMNDPDAATGSNNWVVSGRWTEDGCPLVASDPHIAFEAVSCWYQAHLCGGSFNVAGTAYVGIPAVMFGRNDRVAWGITNNICSLRDLYQEKTDDGHPDCFLFDGTWETARELTETIHLRGGRPIEKTIRFSRNGPIVDDILPPPADETGPVSLRWLGSHEGGWLTAMLGMGRADDVESFRQALRPWHVPTFCMVIADVDGHIALQSTGRIPVRSVTERGYRPGWDPQHQWQGLISFEDMPHVVDPDRDFLHSANHRIAPNDFPFPISGCWSSGGRGRRIRSMIEERIGGGSKFSHNDFRNMHQDVVSMRAIERCPQLVEILRADSGPRIQAACDILVSWDFRAEPDSIGATLFNVFYTFWCRKVAAARFEPELIDLLAKGAEGIAGRILAEDSNSWFPNADRNERVIAAMNQTLDLLTERFGPDMSDWTWSQLHRMSLKHVLSPIGELSQLLDHGGASVRGDMSTVCNTGNGADWSAATGAGYRMIADLATSPPKLQAIDAQSQSGHPGSPHYSDQFDCWISGRYSIIPLDRGEFQAVMSTTLQPERHS